MYAAVAASAPNLANLQILGRGVIQCIQWCVGVDAPLDNCQVIAELSFVPVTNVDKNNPAGPISGVTAFTNGAAANVYGVNFCDMLEVPVSVGEILYLNAAVAGVTTAAIRVLIRVRER
jgi:hypothetical protein